LKNGGLELLLDNVGFIPNLTLNVEKLAFHSFQNPSMRVWPMYECTCIRPTYVA